MIPGDGLDSDNDGSIDEDDCCRCYVCFVIVKFISVKLDDYEEITY